MAVNKTMYKIYFYPSPLWNPDKKYIFWESDNPKFKMFSATLDLEINKAGKLEMDVPYNYYWLTDEGRQQLINYDVDFYRNTEFIQEGLTKFYVSRFEPTIQNGTQTQKETVLWCGRLLSKQRGFYNGIKLTCEGNLTYLLDIIQRPYDYDDIAKYYRSIINQPMDPSGHYYSSTTFPVPIKYYLKYLLKNYNREAIKSNNFTYKYVGDEEKILEDTINKKFSQSEYSQTYTEIMNNFLPSIDGFLLTQYNPNSSDETKRNILRFIGNEKGLSQNKPQTIDFGKNLLDFAETISAESIYTRIIPLGDTYSTLEERRKNAYDVWKKEEEKAEEQKEKDDPNYKAKEIPSWEDSGYAMPDDVDKNKRLCINSKVRFYWKKRWYDSTKIDYKTDSGTHDEPIPSDTIEMDESMSIDVGNRYSAVVFDLSNFLRDKNKKKRMPESENDCENLLETYKEKLKKKGKKWLKKNNKIKVSISISAIDLATLKVRDKNEIKNDYDYIDIGYSIKVISKPHGLNKKGSKFLCTAANIDLLSPGNSTFTLGGSFDALSDKSVKNREKSGKAYNMADASYSV